ncbi:LEAF RUST 10 DISEASE-RESISTANCE LOCUS RECEPTOR-LIKE PROTEIN KINASE-like 1.5 isoform X1 [Amborella trichopoda]|nr:LEAF RUST 10 DISEASE-RESISTANCE LOCUS RECEPTOR-LIKE PROTEIN KINASE-like 1.5 isoform X1 [Amborella trichopoda]|eukprot:XP_006838635.2 LEAF RUST 10 DISEASE-RESISTANCE LOCUS RECEPTOR-LIKE PROTEIN KINASE-like 1.5 isoform X1 [Amborella trichopoda]
MTFPASISFNQPPPLSLILSLSLSLSFILHASYQSNQSTAMEFLSHSLAKLSPPLLFLSLFLSRVYTSTATASYEICSKAAASSCPPFTSFSYPFALSSTNGCGHPAFQIDCTNGHSKLTIGTQKYRVLSTPTPRSLSVIYDDLFESLCSSKSFILNLTSSPFWLPLGVKKNLSLPGCEILSPKNLPCDFCNVVVEWPMASLPGGLDLMDHGFELDFNGTDLRFRECIECMKGNGMCGFNDTDALLPFLCYHARGPPSPVVQAVVHSPPSQHLNHRHVPWSTGFIAFVIGACLMIGAMLAVSMVIGFCKIQPRIVNPYDSSTTDKPLPNCKEAPSNDPSSSFTYGELEKATNHFDEKEMVGSGGYGCVYRGILGQGHVVAVKRLLSHHPDTPRLFRNEINIMSKLSHPNLLSLLGHCEDQKGLLLVYEYVSNGTLSGHLHGPLRGAHLNWKARLNIAEQTACALEYLHTQFIVHRDVKSVNILLEANLSVKVADMGLSRDMVERTHITTSPLGTPGYVDPEYYRTYRLTQASDVYSFGVVLMELVTGMKALEARGGENGEVSLATLAVTKIQSGRIVEMVDPMLASAQGVEAVCELGFACLASAREDRPTMRELRQHLGHIKGELI